MEFQKYEVGRTLNKAIGKGEGVYADVDDTGMQIIVLFHRPTPDEISQFKQGKPFEIRLVTLQNVMMFTLKIGNLNWMDAPYNPHLSLGLTQDFSEVELGKGMGAILILADAGTAQIKSIRMIGLSEKFTREFISEARRLKEKVFIKAEYDSNVKNICLKYNTKEIVKMSDVYCKI